MESENLGIDFAFKLSLTYIDKSNLTFEEKRKLIFSVYSFRCLFDNGEMTYINPILKKYYCTFADKLENHPLYSSRKEEFEQIKRDKTFEIPYGGLYVKDGESSNYCLRFDCGSEVWQYYTQSNKLTGVAATLIKKYSLYEMVNLIVSLSNADNELKAIWYIMFTYIIMIEAPHEVDFYYEIREKIFNEAIFNAVLDSKYSLNFPDTVKEMWAKDFSNTLIDFLLPYIEWKNEVTDKGITREVARFQKWLALGRFSDTLLGSEKLLDSFPDDENLSLVNIAARISLDITSLPEEKEALLKETISILEELLEKPSDKKVFFLYYYGLALIGLKLIDAAIDKFDEVLEINPNFEPALLMKKACNK